MTTVILNGKEIEMDVAANLMDDEIREALHAKGFSTDQDFLNAYVAAHAEKFDEDFTA